MSSSSAYPAWDGARAGLILVAVMCSLMATFPRPLLASQNYNRGLVVAIGLSAIYQFAQLPVTRANAKRSSELDRNRRWSAK